MVARAVGVGVAEAGSWVSQQEVVRERRRLGGCAESRQCSAADSETSRVGMGDRPFHQH